jgi:YfiH family protein
MDINIQKDVVTSKIFSEIPGLVHGFSTRSWGDMRKSKNKDAFISALGLDSHDVYYKYQMHGDIVHYIDASTNLSSLSNADGAIAISNGRIQRKIVLTVRAADCVPIMFVDAKNRSIGVAHAGWQGTILGITGKVIALMEHQGSNPKDIFVFIGSHIGPCCYSIDALRAEKFNKRFLPGDHVIVSRKGTWYADLGRANTVELLKSGITSAHIDVDTVCTSCGVKDRFSYRQDTPETYGVMMGVLAWK